MKKVSLMFSAIIALFFSHNAEKLLTLRLINWLLSGKLSVMNMPTDHR